jgi:UDP-glucose 4-epimerase
MFDPPIRSALVTGGAGFIGSHLVEELIRRGAQVAVADTLSSDRSKNLAVVSDRIVLRRIDLAQDDLRPLLAEGQFDTIFHLAGFASIPESVNFPRRDFDKNAVATLRLLEAAREASPQSRIVFTSSASVYGEGRNEPLGEDDPTQPVAPYGVSKLAAENYLAAFARLYSLRTASLRLFAVYGPRLRNHVIYDLIRKVHQNPNELIIQGDGTQVRDFTYVTNVVEALLSVAGRGWLEGEVYNVGSQEPISIRDLAAMICREMEVAPRLVFSGEVRPGVSLRWCADITRIKQLGYQPQLKLADGLARTVAWFRENVSRL